MTKVQLLKNVSKKTETVTQKDVDLVLSSLALVIEEAMRADDEVTIPGIGKIVVKTVPERRGTILRGDKQGEEYVVPQHKEPKMKLTKAFKNIFV